MEIFRYSLIIFLIFSVISCSDSQKNSPDSDTDSLSIQKTVPIKQKDSLVQISVDINSIVPLEPSEEDLSKLRESGTAPFVINLRKAFNDLLKGKKKSDYINFDFVIVEKNEMKYLKSKFFILSIEQYQPGTEKLDILFKDIPDRVYTCVMSQESGIYQLKYFNINTNFTDGEIKGTLKLYENIFSHDDCAF
jgi:hypothetical protein